MRKIAIPGELKTDPPSTADSRRLAFLRPYVRQTGDQWRKRWHIAPRKLLDYLIVLIASGNGIFSVGDKKDFPVAENDLIWIPPGTLHEMRGSSDKMHCVFIHFDLLYSPQRSHWDAYIPGGCADLSGLASLLHPAVKDPALSSFSGKVSISKLPEIAAIMREICSIHRVFGNNEALMLSGMMTVVLAKIIAGISPNSLKQRPHVKLLEDSRREIETATNAEFKIAKFARKAGLSPSHFRKIFRETYGESPRTLHTRLRMRKACGMMIYHGMNVAETAEMTGFGSIHNFSRAFKIFFGISPKDFAKTRR